MRPTPEQRRQLKEKGMIKRRLDWEIAQHWGAMYRNAMAPYLAQARAMGFPLKRVRIEGKRKHHTWEPFNVWRWMR